MDNKMMVDEINKGRKYWQLFPNTTLRSDWDVVSSLVTTSLKLQDPSFHWIRGHQDTHKPCLSLSFAAVLNCKADDEAGRYQNINIK